MVVVDGEGGWLGGWGGRVIVVDGGRMVVVDGEGGWLWWMK